MDRQKGMAYCGLACSLCCVANCPGCRSGGCSDKDWCKNYLCCKEKGLEGCWVCEDFPCQGTMLDKLRIRSFAEFIKQHGEPCMLDCLERNEKAGVAYHNEGQLIGDYDTAQTEKEIFDLLLRGK